MTLIMTTTSIVEMQRNNWIKGSENHCTSVPFHRAQMSASKASNLVPKQSVDGRLRVQPYADLHSETGNPQDQVKVLIEKTASALDDTALKMLFVSVQQNNIELCIRCAIDEYVMFSFC